MCSALSELAEQLHIELRRDLPLSSCTSFKIGGPADAYLEVQDMRDLPPILHFCKVNRLSIMVVGNGTNLLAGDNGFRGVVIRLSGDPAAIRLSACGEVICPAGLSLKRLCLFAREHALAGLEFAYGIPGTVGGALFMNAGAYGGQMADVTLRAMAADVNGLHEIAAADLELGYRKSLFMTHRELVITEVIFRLTEGNQEEIGAKMDTLLRRRREKQPLEFPSAGSYFKRPEGNYAGALIEGCGLKGYRVGGAQVSEKHAGFVVNRGGASCSDVLQLEQYVQEAVYQQYGIHLEREVQLVGE